MKNLVSRGRARSAILIVLIVSLACVSVYAVSQIITVNAATQKVSHLQESNSRLETELADVKTKLRVYDGVSKSDLLEMCSQKAKANYSDYIRANSVVTKEGNTTYIAPKSPEVNKNASLKLEADEQSCKLKFS